MQRGKYNKKNEKRKAPYSFFLDGGRLEVQGSKFKVRGSRFKVQSSRFVVNSFPKSILKISFYPVPKGWLILCYS
jgi:thiamine pyrophosphokinase